MYCTYELWITWLNFYTFQIFPLILALLPEYFAHYNRQPVAVSIHKKKKSENSRSNKRAHGRVRVAKCKRFERVNSTVKNRCRRSVFFYRLRKLIIKHEFQTLDSFSRCKENLQNNYTTEQKSRKNTKFTTTTDTTYTRAQARILFLASSPI